MGQQNEGYDRTDRRNGRWAKLTKHSTGHYTLATGFDGEFKATNVHDYKTFSHAKVCRESWLDDAALSEQQA